MRGLPPALRAAVLLPLLIAAVHAADNAADSYAFAPGAVRSYDYTLEQTVAWESAGDRLAYRTAILWRFALRTVAVAGPVATVNATYLRVTATHQGPAAEHTVDSAVPGGAVDPVLGHLAAFEGVTLGLTIDQATGRVTAVTGGDAIIAAIDARHPAAMPGDRPPLAEAARTLYAPEALAAWWSQLLALPSAEPQPVPLAPPLAGNLLRTWTGTDYTLALPEGLTELPLALLGEPTPIAGVLREVVGGGSVTRLDGMPGSAGGTLAFTLGLTALTQPVVQRHALTWRLQPTAPPAGP